MKQRRVGFSLSSRISILLWLCYGVGVLLLIRIFALQVLSGGGSGDRAVGNEILARGEIVALDGPAENERFPIAVNEKFFLLYAEPNRIVDRPGTAKKIADIVQHPEEDVRKKIANSRDVYAPLKHFVTSSERDRIVSEHLDGIGLSSEYKRVYPAKNVFAHITGFLGFDDDRRVGQYGLEGWYNDQLQSSGGMSQPEETQSLVISINKTVQDKVCAYLHSGVESFEASGGTAIVMDPFTGDIKALCSDPSYDPNEYGSTDSALFVSPAVSVAYEPGSVYKPITMAAALDAGVVSPSTSYTDTGFVKFGKFTIRNAEDKVYGMVTMTDVLEESINTGVMFAVDKMGIETFVRYSKLFGFGEKTGIDMAGEVSGTISSLESKKAIYAATASFGQGITVTPMQLTRAYAALANGGLLVTPRIGVAFSDGTKETPIDEPREVRQIISPQTSSVISAMLASVVVEGHSRGSSIPGYFIAGKTGTAQVVDPGSGGYGADTIHTFAGYFPLKKPEFVVVVKFDRPKKGKYAESTAVPVFRNIAQFLIQYYKIPPEKQE